MRCAILSILLCLLTVRAWPAEISELLEAAAKHPRVQISVLAARESALRERAAVARLLPRIGSFTEFEIYNSPTNLRPMPPTEVNIQAGEPIPFSRRILRYGLTLEAPVLVWQLYALRQKAKVLAGKAKIDERLDLVSREAAVVSLNGAFQYLDGLNKAIAARKRSLAKTRDDVALKVKNGRAAEAELLKITTTINDLDRQQNELTAKLLDAVRDIKKLTDIDVSGPVSMKLAGEISPAPLLEVQREEMELAAAHKELSQRRATLYPTVSLFGSVSGNQGEAYNTDSDISRFYASAGLVVRFSVFDGSRWTDEAIAKVQLRKQEKKLAATKIELHALADNLRKKLPVVNRSIALAEQSVKNDEELLSIARVAHASGRMTTEDYLHYESQLLAAEAALYQARQEYWQILAQKAVLYGTDLRGVVR